MKRLFSIRALFSLGLLWLAASALVSTLKLSIRGMEDAPFLPVIIPAMLMAYLLGFGNWTMRGAWVFILSFSPILILLQATSISGPLWQILIHLPMLQINAVLGFLTGQPVDFSFFQLKLDEILHLLEIFLRGLVLDGKEPGPMLLEVSWDVPLFLAGAWSGWWASRQNSILIALIPSLGLQVFLLNYARRPEGLSLQIGAFALIFLMGLHQKWSLSKRAGRTQSRVRMETYATVFILCAVLAMAASWAPIIQIQKETPKTVKAGKEIRAITETPEIIQAFETQVAEAISNLSSPPRGLPRDHQITAPPQYLMSVVFLADPADKPFLGTGEIGVQSAAPTYYWRWITYDLYDGSGWSSSTTTSASYPANQPLFEFSGEGYRLVHQTIMKASAEDDHLYWTGSLMRADQPMDASWRTPPGEDPLLHMDMFGTLAPAQQYSVDSLLPQFSETQLRATSQIYPTEILQKYLGLPRNISQRVRDLAVTLTYQAQTPYDKARAIEAYLRTFPYTLDVPALPADKEISDYFLFELKTGYCEYYATSMMVMARTVGLPARMVIGYASNEYDPGIGQYIVRDANAHSWVEIYFPDIGWVEFEPTASQPLSGHSQPLAEEDLNVPAPLTPTIKDRHGIIYDKQGYFVGRSPIFAILLSLLALIGLCLWYLRTQGLWFSYQTIGSIYAYIYRHGKKIYPDAPLNETPSLFAERLKARLTMNHRVLLPAAEELGQLTSLYLKETYSRHPVTHAEQEQAVRIWYRLFWRLLYARMILPLSAVIARSRTWATKQSSND